MIITAKRMITGDGKTILDNAAVLIRDGLIERVDKFDTLCREFPGVERADFGDATILPGLIDMHVHIGWCGHHTDKDTYNEYMIGYNGMDFAKRALNTGVTTLRDLSSPGGLCQTLINASKMGLLNIPRIIHCNKALCATGGHGWNSGGSVEADGEAEIRKAVREQIRAGADWIKIMSTHRSPGVSEYTQEELFAAVDEAKRHKRKTAVHSTLQPSLEYCINAGVDTIEHGTDITEGQAARMAEKGIAWVPTLLVHHTVYKRLQEIIDSGAQDTLSELQWETYNLYKPSVATFKKNLKKYADMGVTILTGTDMVMDGTAPVAEEIALMAEYGINPLAAIAAGTSNCAKVLGMEGEIGILEKGARADIIVVEGDPSKTIEALKNVAAVFLNGKKFADNPRRFAAPPS